MSEGVWESLYSFLPNNWLKTGARKTSRGSTRALSR